MGEVMELEMAWGCEDPHQSDLPHGASKRLCVESPCNESRHCWHNDDSSHMKDLNSEQQTEGDTLSP